MEKVLWVLIIVWMLLLVSIVTLYHVIIILSNHVPCIYCDLIVSLCHVIIPFSHVPDEPIPIDNEIVLTVDPDTLTAFTASVSWTVTSENMEFRLQVKLLGK